MTAYYKIWQILLQNATAVSLQNATELQNATVLLQNATCLNTELSLSSTFLSYMHIYRHKCIYTYTKFIYFKLSPGIGISQN